jgi:lipopolysaccharide export system permease protein
VSPAPVSRKATWKGRAQQAFSVPFGWHTRYVFASHCRHTFLIGVAILTIALSIDLTLFLSKVLAIIASWTTSWPTVYVAWYLVLRGTDFLAELLPLISYFGVFWTEIAHTTSRERLVVWLSGRTPRQCLVPAVLFGLTVGCIQLALNLTFRPDAVMTMARDHLGSYGERFDPRPRPYPQWMALGHDLVQALIEPGNPPSLRDVRIYRMDDSLKLHTFLQAKSATIVGDDQWLLAEGYRWSPPTSNPSAIPLTEQRSFTTETIHLALSPVWLNNRLIPARYLPNSVFSALARESFMPDQEFRTWQNARWSLAIFCAAMTILASTLSTFMMETQIVFSRLAVIGIGGYVINTLMKVSILLGEHGYINPAFSAWFVPISTLAACGAIILVGSKQG